MKRQSLLPSLFFALLLAALFFPAPAALAQGYYIDTGNGLMHVPQGDPNEVKPDHWEIKLYNNNGTVGSITGDSAAAVMKELAYWQWWENRWPDFFQPMTWKHPVGPIAVIRAQVAPRTISQRYRLLGGAFGTVRDAADADQRLEDLGESIEHAQELLQDKLPVTGLPMVDYMQNFADAAKKLAQLNLVLNSPAYVKLQNAALQSYDFDYTNRQMWNLTVANQISVINRDIANATAEFNAANASNTAASGDEWHIPKTNLTGREPLDWSVPSQLANFERCTFIHEFFSPDADPAPMTLDGLSDAITSAAESLGRETGAQATILHTDYHRIDPDLSKVEEMQDHAPTQIPICQAILSQTLPQVTPKNAPYIAQAVLGVLHHYLSEVKDDSQAHYSDDNVNDYVKACVNVDNAAINELRQVLNILSTKFPLPTSTAAADASGPGRRKPVLFAPPHNQLIPYKPRVVAALIQQEQHRIQALEPKLAAQEHQAEEAQAQAQQAQAQREQAAAQAAQAARDAAAAQAAAAQAVQAATAQLAQNQSDLAARQTDLQTVTSALAQVNQQITSDNQETSTVQSDLNQCNDDAERDDSEAQVYDNMAQSGQATLDNTQNTPDSGNGIAGVGLAVANAIVQKQVNDERNKADNYRQDAQEKRRKAARDQDKLDRITTELASLNAQAAQDQSQEATLLSQVQALQAQNQADAQAVNTAQQAADRTTQQASVPQQEAGTSAADVPAANSEAAPIAPLHIAPSNTKINPKDGDVAAVVNGVKIYRFQVPKEALKMVGPQLVNQMILIELIHQTAHKQGIWVTKEQLESRLDQVRQQYAQRVPGGLDTVLTQQHKTLAMYREQLKLEILVEALVAKTLSHSTTATPRFHVKHLLILTNSASPNMAPDSKPPHTDAEALALIAKAQADLAAGKSFEEVADTYTEDPFGKGKGGDLGLIDAKTPFDPAFMKAALALKPGEVTAIPVRSVYGYHLIKIVSSNTAPLPTDAKMYADAAEADRLQEIQQATPAYIQNLRANAKIVDYMNAP